MHQVWQHGRVLTGGSNMNKAKIIRILVTIEAVFGILMIWLIIR